MQDLLSTLLSIAAYAQATDDEKLSEKVQELIFAAMTEIPESFASRILADHGVSLKAGLSNSGIGD